ncbi:MAG: hypothetical protein BWZ02_03298 [Lentisphaerae bacterium ADurb.BinA184]|nr:MAG: hypothetical protein BWZ02_03298 [Lentisphaerae bacterium ADurb.BinA184]
MKITAPDGKVAFEQVVDVTPQGFAIAVPAGAPGTYRLDMDCRGTLNYYWLESDLERSVLYTGAINTDIINSQGALYTPFVPRTWSFWVPAGTERFTVWTHNNSGRSHREDHGLTVFSPRGQRMTVLWGQANPDTPATEMPGGKFQVQQAEVLVEPGSAGRFWSIEVRVGDSHTYSDIHFVLHGVPPYVARSPEEWFDPETGRPPDVKLYDDSEFVQSDLADPKQPRLIQHWTPCPALGDPDGCEIRTPARLALWNPDDRPLRFVIGTYLPRNMSPDRGEKAAHGWKELPIEEHDHAQVRALGAGGSLLFDDRMPLRHLHGGERGERTLRTGAGVATLDITAAEHFWTYTYPGTPLVMIGTPQEGGWQRFTFEAGTPRDWFFSVPRGTKAFAVRAQSLEPGDVIQVAVCAPDRTMGMIFGRAGETTVEVPDGMDGRVWHVRPETAGASRFAAEAARPRFPNPTVQLDLRGVPGLLAPTWEQWFDPARPVPPARR